MFLCLCHSVVFLHCTTEYISVVQSVFDQVNPTYVCVYIEIVDSSQMNISSSLKKFGNSWQAHCLVKVRWTSTKLPEVHLIKECCWLSSWWFVGNKQQWRCHTPGQSGLTCNAAAQIKSTNNLESVKIFSPKSQTSVPCGHSTNLLLAH